MILKPAGKDIIIPVVLQKVGGKKKKHPEQSRVAEFSCNMCSENYHWDFSVILPIDIWLHQNTKQFSNLSSTLSSGHKNQLLCTQQIIVCAGNIVLGNEGIYLFRVTHSCRMNYSKPAVQFHFKQKVKKIDE